MILSPAFNKNPEGCRGEQIINGIQATLLTPWRPQCPPARPPRRLSGSPKCYVGSCRGSFHKKSELRGLQRGVECGSSTGPTITIITPWRPPWWPFRGHAQGNDCASVDEPLPPRIQHFTEAEGCYIEFFFFILYYVLFTCNTKKSSW